MIVETPLRSDRRLRRALVHVLARAFRDNPMNVAIHGPDPRRRVRANRAGLRAVVQDSAPGLETRVCIDGGRVLGGLVAAPPELRVLPAAALARQLGRLLHQGPRAMSRWANVDEVFIPLRPIGPHWRLSVLGVDPRDQGRGVGARLLASLLEELRARSGRRLEGDSPLRVYLECDRPRSVAFYRSHGFEVLHELEAEGVRCWGLGLDLGATA